jgi:hypothetical protein
LLIHRYVVSTIIHLYLLFYHLGLYQRLAYKKLA